MKLRLAIAVVTAFAIYVGLLVAVMLAVFASGGGVSCSSNCNGLESFLSDAEPWPMLAAIALSICGAFLVAQRRR